MVLENQAGFEQRAIGSDTVDISRPFILALVSAALLSACSDPIPDTPAQSDASDPALQADATLTVTGLPVGAEVVTLTWFPGREDDDPQGIIYEYADGMTIPAGKLMFLIEGDGYEPLLARRIPVYGNTVLEAKMCKLGEGCYGTLTDKTPRN